MEFHHLGIACRDLDAETTALAPLGYAPEGDDFIDPLQGVHGRFLTGLSKSYPRLELLIALPNSEVLRPWLERGIRVYHDAFLVDDLQVSISSMISHGAHMIIKPIPAVAFGGRLICFLMLRNMHLVELIQRSPRP